MSQDFEIYNECLEQSENASGEPALRTQFEWNGVCVAIFLTLAWLSAGGGSDLILPEVFTRVCMAKQLMPGRAHSK
jgi:hypothetical protein